MKRTLKKVPSKDEMEKMEKERIELSIGELVEARKIAAELFEVSVPTTEMIAGVAARVFLYEEESDQQEVIDELYKAFGHAKTVFAGTASVAVPVDFVFFTFDWVYAETDEEDEEE